MRTPGEFASGAIPSAINIPLDRLSGDSLPTDDTAAKIVVYCLSGSRPLLAKRTLEKPGFSGVVDFGGIGRWRGELVRP